MFFKHDCTSCTWLGLLYPLIEVSNIWTDFCSKFLCCLEHLVQWRSKFSIEQIRNRKKSWGCSQTFFWWVISKTNSYGVIYIWYVASDFVFNLLLGHDRCRLCANWHSSLGEGEKTGLLGATSWCDFHIEEVQVKGLAFHLQDPVAPKNTHKAEVTRGKQEKGYCQIPWMLHLLNICRCRHEYLAIKHKADL